MRIREEGSWDPRLGFRRWDLWLMGIPSGKHTKNYGKSPFFMGKFTINGDSQ